MKLTLKLIYSNWVKLIRKTISFSLCELSLSFVSSAMLIFVISICNFCMQFDTRYSMNCFVDRKGSNILTGKARVFYC